MKIYPEMIEKIKNISYANKPNGRKFHEQKIFEDYLIKLLIDNRLNDFHRIAEIEKIFKSCHHVIYNKLINCSKVDIGIIKYDGKLLNVNHLNYSETSDKSKIEKISLGLNPFHRLEVNLFLYHSNAISGTPFAPNQNTIIKSTFSSFSLRKLSSIENECISENDIKNFGEDYFDLIIFDCIFKLLNQSYGCLPIDEVFQLYFDRDILKNGYKFCRNITIDSMANVWKECLKLDKPKCNSINFNTKIETTKFLSNQTIVELIPKISRRIAYFETLKTDFDRLIYNCGGVLGLWFGLSPINTVYYLPLILKFMKPKIIKFIHYSKAVSFRFAKILFGICKGFGLYLIINIIAFAYNLIAVFKRFVQNLFIICKIFGLYLFGISVRFGKNLIRICKRIALFLSTNKITFAYNLMAVFKRFVQNLFGFYKRFGFYLITKIIGFTYNLMAFFIRFVHYLFVMITRKN